ncbi:hypothetical protein PPIS_a2132 [Pseudoalteromonas piscicida]|uniref:Uncharacterized protein n=1 Tax=Pseudoalteromonas piscicida TaxID=43662 RepID=A0ABN5CE28_PSEO7|nr:hypothetical protein PPIS_a2132 [Pseudoalteromonas piscicida]
MRSFAWGFGQKLGNITEFVPAFKASLLFYFDFLKIVRYAYSWRYCKENG